MNYFHLDLSNQTVINFNLDLIISIQNYNLIFDLLAVNKLLNFLQNLFNLMF